MYNSKIPSPHELPSYRQLWRSTAYALGVASLLMTTVVLPAEYGRDPTGIGSLLGLTAMGEIKQSLAKEAAKEAATTTAAPASTTQPQTIAAAPVATPVQAIAVPAPSAETTPAVPTQTAISTLRSDEMKVTLAPDASTEIKVTLKQGQKVNYTWASTGKTNFDIHGDSTALQIDYHGYGKGSKERDEGVIEAAFDGNHGWFWRNRTKQTVTLVLTTQGEYSKIVQVD